MTSSSYPFPQLPNRRREPRTLLSLPATVTTDSAIYSCRVADLSASGARLEFETPVFLRRGFTLHVEDLLVETCQTRWHQNSTMGVAFTRQKEKVST